MDHWSKEHVKAEERLFGRRRDDLLGFRTAHVVLLLIVAILVAFGFAQKLDDWWRSAKPCSWRNRRRRSCTSCGSIAGYRRA